MRRARWLRVVAATAAVLVAGKACGQGLPPLSPAVEQRISADFLTPDEQRDLRVYHGLWTLDDLDTPERRAAAALMVGAFDHPWLGDDAPMLDRAEAMVVRGDLIEAIDVLQGDGSLRGLRLRAEAQAGLGRFADADATLADFVRLLSTEKVDVNGLVEGVRGLLLRTQIRGPAREGGTDYQQILSLVNKARDEMDRLAWPVRLVEAEMLYSRHNRAQAAEAALETLSLNPRCAEALALLGRLQVDGFNFEGVEAIATQLDSIAGELEAVSAPAMEIRARALLRQREPLEAREPIDALLGAYPQHRVGLALSAASAAGIYDEKRTAELLALMDLLSPGHPLGHYEVGRVQAETRQYSASHASLTEAIVRMPTWSAPFIELGLMHTQSGDDAAAMAALERAMALDPFNARAANSLSLLQQLATYARVESEHFVVRYRPETDEVLAREMLPILERIHERVCGDDPGGLDHEPEGKTVIELMPNHEWFSVRITGMPSIHTMAASTGPVIAMESPKEGPGSIAGPYDWPRVLQHEYAHTVSLSRTKNRITHWFTEALAVHLEDAPRDANTWKLLAMAFERDELFDLDEINIAFVRPRKPTDRAQAYAQGHWMYEFIIERWGERAPLQIMDLAAAGMGESAALQRVLGLDRAGFMGAFEPWAEAQLVAAGMRVPDGEPALVELLEPAMKEWSSRAEPPAALERVEEIRRIAAEHPQHPEVIEALVMAEVELSGGEPTEALLPLLERAVELRPVDDLAHRLLARWYLSRPGESDRLAAIEHLEFLDVRSTQTAVYATELAMLYFAAGDVERARVKAERATLIAPFDPSSREIAARIALVRGELDIAERHIDAMARVEPDRARNTRLLEAVRARRAAEEASPD